MKKHVCFVFIGLLTCLVVDAAEGKAKADWRIEVVPSRNSNGKGAVLYAKKPLDVFYVVLHNQSGKDQKVWRDWSPWGYDNLSFTAHVGDGEEVRVTRLPNNWDKSYPDAALVKAGSCYVFEIHLAGKTWKGYKEIGAKPFKLSVVFKVTATAESKEKGVWTGELKSSPIQVTLRR
ncbi:MAG: hypothetical protein AB8F34_15725 [Akkermansiaceae bacterium]